MLIEVGNRCGTSATYDDLPNQGIQILQFLAVDDDAPTVTLPAAVGTGVPTAISGSGFRPDTAVTCGDLGPTSAFRVRSDGTFSGSVVVDPILDAEPTLFDCIDGQSSDPERRTAVAEADLVRPVVTATLSRTTATYGSARSVRVTATIGSADASGPIEVREGATVLGRGTLSAGAVTIALPPTAAVGRHALQAVFYSTTTSRTLTVAKATPSLSLALSPKTVKSTKRAVATVRVVPRGAVAGVYATGTVRVLDGSRTLATASLTTSRKGTVVVRLPTITRLGKHGLRAVYSGSGQVAGGTSSAVGLTVTR